MPYLTTKSHIKTLHLDTELTWRGGENQIKILIDGLGKAVENHLAAPPNSAISRKLGNTIPVKELPMSGLSLLPTAWKLKIYCQNHGIDILDAHTSKAHSLALLIKKFLPEIKLIVHRRVDYRPSHNAFSRWKYRTPLVDHYIAISHAIRNILRQEGINEQIITTIPSAVLPPPPIGKSQIEQLKKNLQIPSHCQIMANIGYLTPQKGQETLLKALPLVIQSFPHFHCLIAGDGPLRQTLEKQAESLKIGKYLTFLGIRDDVPLLLQAADILVMPSNDEGLGTSILDGLLANCCVIATKVGGIPEIIRHEETGLLSPKGDEVALAQNLLRALRDKKIASEMAKKGHQFIKENFSVDQLVTNTKNIYEKIIMD